LHVEDSTSSRRRIKTELEGEGSKVPFDGCTRRY